MDYLKINNVYSKEYLVIILANKSNTSLLSFAQERLWFIEQYEDGSNAYNIPMVFKVSDDIELDVLEKSIRSIVNRHEVLRTLIKQDHEGNGYQVAIDEQIFPLSIKRIRVTNHLTLDQELEKEINHIYDFIN